MLDAERFDAIMKHFEDYAASAAEEIDRAPLFEPCDEPPPRLAKIHVTFFRNHAAASLTTENLTLFELQERVQNASARKKSNLPWLKLAAFGNKRTDKNSLRHDDNVLQITGIELDYDGENIAFDDMLKLVEEMGISALTYTSPSHTSAAQRWRILAPISQRLQPEMRAKLVTRLDGYLKAKLGAKTIAASESFALSQAYYYGWVMNKPGLDHRVEVLIGDFIDLRDDLATFEANGGRAANDATNKAAAGKSQDEQDHQAHGFDAILGELGDGDGLNGFWTADARRRELRQGLFRKSRQREVEDDPA